MGFVESFFTFLTPYMIQMLQNHSQKVVFLLSVCLYTDNEHCVLGPSLYLYNGILNKIL